MGNRFHRLIESLATNVERDYLEARQHAREHDPQRAGHEGESTWVRLLAEWGPGWPVVTRRYLVGPEGETNEVDVVVLKPDYPAHLRDEPSVLISGVAAAFSSKLTLRRSHIAEALRQKKRILAISGGNAGSVRETLCGHFPFGLLSHSTELLAESEDFGDALQRLYLQIAHNGTEGPIVTHPREEIDALLIADKGFFSTLRVARAPRPPNATAWGPMTSLNRYPGGSSLRGAPLVQFITWLRSQSLPTPNDSSLKALETMFETDRSQGYMTPWPMSIYSDHVQRNPQMLMGEAGGTLLF